MKFAQEYTLPADQEPELRLGGEITVAGGDIQSLTLTVTSAIPDRVLNGRWSVCGRDQYDVWRSIEVEVR